MVAALLASPRRRRRLGWTLGTTLLVAALVFVAVKYRNTGQPLDNTIERSSPPAAIAPTPALRVTPAVRRRVSETVDRFVHTAVIRQNLAAAWPLASPAMRAGVTREDWARGDIPVQPFPAKALADADWLLRYRTGRTLGIDVMVQPKQGSGERVLVYAAELTAPGTGPPRRFLVDSWVAQTTLGAASGPAEAGARTGTGTGGEAGADIYDQGKLGAEWFLVPLGIVVLLALALVGFAVRGVLQRRRAERRFREGRL